MHACVFYLEFLEIRLSDDDFMHFWGTIMLTCVCSSAHVYAVFGCMYMRACVYGAYRNIYKDKQELEMVAQSDEDVESWKASLLRAGVYPVRSSECEDTIVSIYQR